MVNADPPFPLVPATSRAVDDLVPPPRAIGTGTPALPQGAHPIGETSWPAGTQFISNPDPSKGGPAPASPTGCKTCNQFKYNRSNTSVSQQTSLDLGFVSVGAQGSIDDADVPDPKTFDDLLGMAGPDGGGYPPVGSVSAYSVQVNVIPQVGFDQQICYNTGDSDGATFDVTGGLGPVSQSVATDDFWNVSTSSCVSLLPASTHDIGPSLSFGTTRPR